MGTGQAHFFTSSSTFSPTGAADWPPQGCAPRSPAIIFPPLGGLLAVTHGLRLVVGVDAGYGNMMSILGSATATFALVLPSFILMILISRMFLKYMNTPAVQSIFKGLRPAVVGLLGAATLLLMTPENFSLPSVNPWQFWISCALFVATFIGTYYVKISPIRMIFYSAIAGLVLLY